MHEWHDWTTGCWVKIGLPPLLINPLRTIFPTILRISESLYVLSLQIGKANFGRFCQKFQKVLENWFKRGKFIKEGDPFFWFQHSVLAFYGIFTGDMAQLHTTSSTIYSNILDPWFYLLTCDRCSSSSFFQFLARFGELCRQKAKKIFKIKPVFISTANSCNWKNFSFSDKKCCHRL